MELSTFRPLHDIADMERLVATRVSTCIATSELVRSELLRMGVPGERVRVIHNALEDYWFETTPPPVPSTPQLVFLGRLGADVFTLKLKGLSRLIRFYRAFPNIEKTSIYMTANKKLKEWLRVAFPNHHMFVNLRKDLIPPVLARLYGSILYISSRYEGFSLSLVEGMSQGLVPITYGVGVAPEIIRDGVNGYIVQSHEEAVERAQELLDNTDKRLQMATEARKTALQFRSNIIADNLMSVYQELRSSFGQKN